MCFFRLPGTEPDWPKIRNGDYSQWIGRKELFERERESDPDAVTFKFQRCTPAGRRLAMKPRTMLIALVFSSLLASTQAQEHPGREPYTPTKQEWILVEVGPCFLGADGRSVASISAGYDSETITVDLYYNDHATASEVDALYSVTRLAIEGSATRHGWLKWVKLARKDHPHQLKGKFGCPQG